MDRQALCPYCGVALNGAARCPSCRGLLDPLSRQASQNDMGAWFIRDERMPFRPGCSLRVLKALALRGRLEPETPVRGPTTRQFWLPAGKVPGLAHVLGSCHACGGVAEAEETVCEFCGASFEVRLDRQDLGLAAIVPVPGHATEEEIAGWAAAAAVAPIEHVPPVPLPAAPPPPQTEGAEEAVRLRLRRHTARLRAMVVILAFALVAAVVVLGLAVLDWRAGLGSGVGEALTGKVIQGENPSPETTQNSPESR